MFMTLIINLTAGHLRFIVLKLYGYNYSLYPILINGDSDVRSDFCSTTTQEFVSQKTVKFQVKSFKQKSKKASIIIVYHTGFWQKLKKWSKTLKNWGIITLKTQVQFSKKSANENVQILRLFCSFEFFSQMRISLHLKYCLLMKIFTSVNWCTDIIRQSHTFHSLAT